MPVSTVGSMQTVRQKKEGSRRGGLYAKVLLALILAVLVTISAAGLFFHILRLRDAPDRFERIGLAQAIVLNELVLMKWKEGGARGLKPLLQEVADSLHARIRLVAPDGRILVATEHGEERSFHGKEKDLGPVRIRHDWRAGLLLITVPIQRQPLLGAELQLLIERPDDGWSEFYRFLLAMLLTGTVLALLAIPLSRKLSAPLQELRQSAHRIAEGDLSRRADVKSKDEIGALARDFNRMAERVEAMILSSRHLLAHVSHELRSPLARIRILAAMIEDEQGNPQIAKRASAMQLEIEDMDRLIGAILDFSKAGMLREAVEEQVDLAGELRFLLERQDPLLRKKELQLDLSISENVPKLCLRRQALRTLLGALLDNAVRFAPGKTAIRIEMYQRRVITIRIMNEYREKEGQSNKAAELLRPFYREADESDELGYGLGLAQAKAAADALGATFSIDRREGRFVARIELISP